MYEKTMQAIKIGLMCIALNVGIAMFMILWYYMNWAIYLLQ